MPGTEDGEREAPGPNSHGVCPTGQCESGQESGCQKKRKQGVIDSAQEPQKAFLVEMPPELGAEEKQLAINQVKKGAKHQQEAEQIAQHVSWREKRHGMGLRPVCKLSHLHDNSLLK